MKVGYRKNLDDPEFHSYKKIGSYKTCLVISSFDIFYYKFYLFQATKIHILTMKNLSMNIIFLEVCKISRNRVQRTIMLRLLFNNCNHLYISFKKTYSYQVLLTFFLSYAEIPNSSSRKGCKILPTLKISFIFQHKI